MVSQPQEPRGLRGVRGLRGLNDDLTDLLEQSRRIRTERAARENAVNALNVFPDKAVEQLQRQRSVEAAMQSTQALEPQDQQSFLERVMGILDAPARHVARPAMGYVLGNAYKLIPGEQEGEAELRDVVGLNPFAVFAPDRADKVRDALKETDLPFGLYTAMELALDPLTYVPGAAFVKAAKGGKAALGLKSPIAREASQKIGRLIPLNERVDLVMTDNMMRRVGERLTSVPVVRQTVGVVNPSAAAKSDIGRTMIGYSQLLEDSEGLVATAVSSLAGRRNPFQIIDGMAVLKDGSRMPWGDVFQKARTTALRGKLTDEQLKYVDEYTGLLAGARQYLDDLKIPVREIELDEGERFIPRFVLGKDNVEKFRAGITTSKAVGAKQSFQRPRYFQTMQEGIDNGIDYLNDPLGVLAQHLRGVYRTVADEDLLTKLRPLGTTISERMPTSLKLKAATAANKKAALVKASQLINRAARGEEIPLSSIRAVERQFPDVGQALRSAMGAERRVKVSKNIPGAMELESTFKATVDKKAQLQALKSRVDSLANAAEQPFLQAKADLKLAREIASRPKIGEAFVQQPGLSGRIFPREVADELGKQFNQRANGFVQGMGEVNAAMRIGLTGFDFGAGMIQGLPLLATNPAGWVRAQGAALRSLFDPDALSRYISKHSATIQEMAQHGGVVNVDEFVESILAGGGIERLLVKGGKGTTPLRGGLKRAAAAFTTFGTAARVELFEAMKPMAMRAGLKRGLSEREIIEQLTETVGKMTGVSGKARLGINAARSDWERSLLFAPRYLRASLGLVSDTAQGGLRGQLARQSMGKMLAGGLLMYYGWAAAMGQEPKLDPRRSDFLTVEIAGQRVGLGSIWTSLARTTAGIYSQVERGDADQLISIDPDKSILARFTRFRASPIVGLGWDTVRGRDAIGAPVGNPIEQPLEFAADMPRYLAPFWAQQFIEDDSPIEGDEVFGVNLPAEVLGFRAFPTSIFSEQRTRRETLAQAAYKTSWEDLTGLQRKALNEGDETLKFYDAQIRAWRLERGDDLSKLRAQYFEKQDEYREGYNSAVEDASREWLEGRSSGRQWRERVLNAGRDRRVLFQELNGPTSVYQPAIEDLKSVRGPNGESAVEDIAYDEYISRVVLGISEDGKELANVFGEIDFRERDRRVDDIKVKYGEDVWQAIQVRLQIGKGNDPALNEWHQGLELFRPYWEVGDVLANQRGVSDVWDEYKQFQGTAHGDAIAENMPMLKEIESIVTKSRQEMRRRSPALEAFLLKYGYVSSVTNNTVKKLTQAQVEQHDFDPLALPLSNR